jgi:TP901 family phage tail tape measure protein
MIASYEGVAASEAGAALIEMAAPFKLSGDQFGYLADQITRASAASTGGFSDFAAGAVYAAPRIAALGIEIKDMLTMQAMLAQSGLKGGIGGTSLAAMYSEGVASKFIGQEESKDPLKLIEKLKKSIEGLNETDALRKITELGFGDRSIKAVMALISQDFNAMKESMESAASLAEKTEITVSGLNSQLKILKNTAANNLAGMFESALLPLTKMVGLLNDANSAMGRFITQNPNFAKGVTALSFGGAAALGLWGTQKIGAGILSGAVNPRNMIGLLRSGGGLARGLATGQMLQAATGVQSVFVTNQIDEHKLAAAAAGANVTPAALGPLGRATGGLLRALPFITVAATALSAGYSVSSWFADDINKQADLKLKREQFQRLDYVTMNNTMMQIEKAKADAERMKHWSEEQKNSYIESMKERYDYGRTVSLESLKIMPDEFEQAFKESFWQGGYTPKPKEFEAFAEAWGKYGGGMWEQEGMYEQFNRIYAVLSANEKAQSILTIKMTQESENNVIKNREFEIKTGAGERARVMSIRGENIRSFTRNV